MSEQEILETIRQAAIEDHEYFGNKNKPYLEKYVASLFLSILGVDHKEDDLHAEIEASSVDVGLVCCIGGDIGYQKQLSSPEGKGRK